MGFDPRLTLARPDLAAAALEGVVPATRYSKTTRLQVIASAAPLHRSPDLGSELLDELLFGERFEALETQGDFVWGQARRDGYVGFVPAAAFAPEGEPPTHRLTALRAFAFAEPQIRAPAVGPFSLNALVRIEEESGSWGRADSGAWFWLAHLAPIGARFERDAAAVAERFLGTPYRWSGRTSVGIDCSGLVQQALYACGLACPRDADLQAGLGRVIGRSELTRGDLVAWHGHIGLMVDETRLLHANAHHMAVALEPLAETIARYEAAGEGPPIAFRRL
ncbi:MAG TPA: NlpC/P60 family protein [Caulobacteraceae bacterium]|jgi:cell wall-associated NlpC family hydrolase